jgi:hypothetical protein
MVPNHVDFIRQVPSERFQVGKEWCGKRKIGLTRRRFPTEGWMTRVSQFSTAHIKIGWSFSKQKKFAVKFNLPMTRNSIYRGGDQDTG